MQDFVQNFLSQYRKISLGNPSVFQKIPGIEKLKILWIRRVEGGGFTIRNRKNICHDRDSNPGPTASEPCCPNPTAVIYF